MQVWPTEERQKKMIAAGYGPPGATVPSAPTAPLLVCLRSFWQGETSPFTNVKQLARVEVLEQKLSLPHSITY